MGRGLAKLLAQKGANVVIVARKQQKLSEALQYISVRYLSTLTIETLLIGLIVLSKEPSISKVPFHQCRCNEV